MHIFVWIGFLVSIILMIIIARKNIWLGFFCGALLLGILNLPPLIILQQIKATIFDLSIVLLAVNVGLIPLIGGGLEESGLMTKFVSNLNISRKLFLILGPAFFGMLPMPGGALLSAPLVLRAGEDISDNLYTAINVWFRHALVLIYPLAALLVTSKMANLNLYLAMIYLLPGFVIMIILGYIYFLIPIKGKLTASKSIKLKNIYIPVIIIVTAPLLHVILKSLFPNIIEEIPLVIGILTSLCLTLYFGKLKIKSLFQISSKMKPWKYFLIIIGMFLFLNIFKASNISNIISEIIFAKSFLIVGISFFLGFVTGRVQMPFAIILPIYYSTYNINTIAYITFAVMFFSIFMGYIISPIHPCVSVSLEFFGSNLKDFFKKLLSPTIIAILIALFISILFVR